jgi:hypothetical protein
MPKTLTVGHRSLLASVQAWLRQRLGMRAQAWPPSRPVAGSRWMDLS